MVLPNYNNVFVSLLHCCYRLELQNNLELTLNEKLSVFGVAIRLVSDKKYLV